MTPEEINIAICAHVWGSPVMNSICEECFGTGRNGSEGDCYPCDRCNQTGTVSPRYTGPNYCSDLNAMNKAEETLPSIKSYVRILDNLVWQRIREEPDLPTFAKAMLLSRAASAALRAEAFLRTCGKWKEAA